MSRRLVAAALVVVLALLLLRWSPALSAGGGVEVVVTDDKGKPVADAVVSLTPTSGPPPAPRPTPAVLDQVNREFVPQVLTVGVGTPVTFPNRDNIRHHVYSFSSPKKFELPLYIGTPATPIVFDKPGVVVLGCNIHDWMVGYVYVLATPYAAKTGADGRARVEDLPPDTYEARVWHPRMRSAPEKTDKRVTVAAGEPGQLAFQVPLKPETKWAPSRGYEQRPQS